MTGYSLIIRKNPSVSSAKGRINVTTVILLLTSMEAVVMVITITMTMPNKTLTTTSIQEYSTMISKPLPYAI